MVFTGTATDVSSLGCSTSPGRATSSLRLTRIASGTLVSILPMTAWAVGPVKGGPPTSIS